MSTYPVHYFSYSTAFHGYISNTTGGISNNPYILVNKEDGTKCLVIVFRKTIKLIKTTTYPLPRIEDILAS